MTPAFPETDVDSEIPPSYFSLQVSWTRIFISLSLCYVLHLLVKYFRKKYAERELKKKILHKRAVVLSTKRRLKNYLAEDEEAMKNKDIIVEKPVIELLNDLRNGVISATRVLHAYQLKALEEDDKTNCVVEFIEEAERWADSLDKSLMPKGPLHGLPISVKDNIYIKGYDCTLGMVSFVDKPVDNDANIIKLLKEAGAIPFVKTNIPQTCMTYHCINPVFGKTVHPLDPTRTCGGSSGGEAALIAGKGSPFGLGTDIGGSGRIPPHFCGLFSLKPTANRLSPKTSRELLEGIVGVYTSITPIARDTATIVLVMRTLLNEKMFDMDPEVVPVPFNETLFSSKKQLKIGFYTDDGFATPTPGCQRAVMEAKVALEKAGHELIEFKVPDPWVAFRLAMKIILADRGDSIMRYLGQDIIDERLLFNVRMGTLPDGCKKFAAAVMKGVSPRGSIIIGDTGCSGYQFWQALAERKKYVDLFITTWKESHLDVLIAPGFSIPAPPHQYPEKLLPNTLPTIMYNLLNFPVGAVPITKESEQDQIDLDGYRQDDLAFRLARKATRGALNMPIGVQIVALPWQEELVLRVMSELETTMKSRNVCESSI